MVCTLLAIVIFTCFVKRVAGIILELYVLAHSLESFSRVRNGYMFCKYIQVQ